MPKPNAPVPALRKSWPDTRSYIAPSDTPCSFVNRAGMKSMRSCPVVSSLIEKDEILQGVKTLVPEEVLGFLPKRIIDIVPIGDIVVDNVPTISPSNLKNLFPTIVDKTESCQLVSAYTLLDFERDIAHHVK